MKVTTKQFRQNPKKAITLLGMSGVGKTAIASKLPSDKWFHYSGDYRIGTQYLDDPILDNIKAKAMEHPFLRDLLCRDAIYIRNNITNDHLQPISLYLGKIGNPDLGGLSVEEFKYRQHLFRRSEINAMNDVPVFIKKARQIYSYPHFINDAGGSICHLSDEECWNELSDLTVILYLQASPDREKELLQQAIANPKPLFYTEGFLDSHLAEFLEENNLRSTEEIIPDEFVKWVFPKLMHHRRPLYEEIADKYGYTVDANQLYHLCSKPDTNDQDVVDFICDTIVKVELR